MTMTDTAKSGNLTDASLPRSRSGDNMGDPVQSKKRSRDEQRDKRSRKKPLRKKDLEDL
jgi:hypothetical protein